MSYTGPLRDEFERAFGEKTNTFYTIKSPATDIQSLADIIAKDLIVCRRVRDVGFEVPAIFQIGLERLAKGGLTSFNLWISNAAKLLDDLFDSSPNDLMDNADILDDFSVLGLMVCCHFASCMGLLLIYILASI